MQLVWLVQTYLYFIDKCWTTHSNNISKQVIRIELLLVSEVAGDFETAIPLTFGRYSAYLQQLYPCWPGRVAQSVGHLTRKSGVLGSIPGLATYFRFSFRFLCPATKSGGVLCNTLRTFECLSVRPSVRPSVSG